MKKWIALASVYGLLLAAYLGLGIEEQARTIYARRALAKMESRSTQSKTQDELKKASSETLHPVSACCTDKVPVPRDHPPLRILLGDGVYSVVYVSHDWLMANHSYAMSDPDQHLIVLDRQRNPVQVRQDVTHELLHIALRTGDKAPKPQINLERLRAKLERAQRQLGEAAHRLCGNWSMGDVDEAGCRVNDALSEIDDALEMIPEASDDDD